LHDTHANEHYTELVIAVTLRNSAYVSIHICCGCMAHEWNGVLCPNVLFRNCDRLICAQHDRLIVRIHGAIVAATDRSDRRGDRRGDDRPVYTAY